ncbi:MAG: hypothetical protein FGM33_07840 [Candidatus Kapabacteria bacterium]|nr:hypothetical protein [Candidatus Kapabacteria bacterium]
MIQRIKAWFGVGSSGSIEQDEVMVSLRHRAAHTTMNLTVAGCLIGVVAIRFWFPVESSVLITLLIVALFIMITTSLIRSYHGVDLAENELLRRHPLKWRYLLRRVLVVFPVVFLVNIALGYQRHGAEPMIRDLFQSVMTSLLWTLISVVIPVIAARRINKRKSRIPLSDG